ncbi:hypothetical protein DOT_5492 [Desulfosporosinus sp. OT]|nr:hypothetical protein DOT_5492 [Desulfosporosinus sp. OT]
MALRELLSAHPLSPKTLVMMFTGGIMLIGIKLSDFDINNYEALLILFHIYT